MNGGGGSKKGQSGRIPTSKPFCDCRRCECKNCPDIIQKLAISIKDSNSKRKSSGKGLKWNKSKCHKPSKKVSQTSEHRPSILDMLNPDRNCDCEIMARAIRSHIHMNMGITERRGSHSSSHRTSDQRPSNSKDTN